MRARDFGVTDDLARAAFEDVRPYRDLSPSARYLKFLELESLYESIWRSLSPDARRRSDHARLKLDDPGRWWERIPQP